MQIYVNPTFSYLILFLATFLEWYCLVNQSSGVFLGEAESAMFCLESRTPCLCCFCDCDLQLLNCFITSFTRNLNIFSFNIQNKVANCITLYCSYLIIKQLIIIYFWSKNSFSGVVHFFVIGKNVIHASRHVTCLKIRKMEGG